MSKARSPRAVCSMTVGINMVDLLCNRTVALEVSTPATRKLRNENFRGYHAECPRPQIRRLTYRPRYGGAIASRSRNTPKGETMANAESVPLGGPGERRLEITRRQALKRGAILGGALAWATPVVQVIGMK